MTAIANYRTVAKSRLQNANRILREITVIPTPLHPALVHLPLGLAFILPALALGFAWAVWKNPLKRRAWTLIVVLQAVLLGAGFVAMNTGEREGERIERAVPKAAIERHEELAEQFIWATGITLVVAAGALVFRRPGAVRALTGAAVLGTSLVAAAALRVGHAGGQLVYVHNAGAAYTSEKRALAQAPIEQTNLVNRASADDHHDDR
jgi:uncharacterized membrane protein